MRVHHYDGDGFCVVPIDGVPCLGNRFDRTRHVQGYKGAPKATTKNVDYQSHQLRVSTMNGQPVRYFVLTDYNAYRRVVIGQHTSLERCQNDLDDPILQSDGQMWVEDLQSPVTS